MRLVHYTSEIGTRPAITNRLTHYEFHLDRPLESQLLPHKLLRSHNASNYLVFVVDPMDTFVLIRA